MSDDKLSQEEMREDIKNIISWGHAHDYDDIIREAREYAWERGYDQAHEDLANDGFGEFQSPNPYRKQEEA